MMPDFGRKRTYQIIGVGFGTLLAGSLLVKAAFKPQSTSDVFLQSGHELQSGAVQVKDINLLKALPPKDRAAKLTKIAQSRESVERSRARYLLATELLAQGQANQALQQLDKLEQDYPVLASHVRVKRSQAYEQAGQQDQAQAEWKAVLAEHPNDAVTVEALYALGKAEPQYWDQAIAKFPAHPKTIEIVQTRLKQNPNQLELLRVMARHGLYVDGYTQLLDRLVDRYAKQLTAADWEAIAFGYWEKQAYGKAGIAYAKAPATARNVYRIARGLQLGEKPGATLAYQQMIAAYPDAPETGLALLRISQLVDQKAAIAYLDQAINRFPDHAGAALLEKSKILDALNSKDTAAQTRRTLLSQYGTSDAAAELRWQLAQERAKAGDLAAAINWVKPIPAQNAESEFAPEATFWMGKWATRLGQAQQAQQAFEQVLTQHPDSYYAWRSASMLGWEVGDFTSVRQLDPAIARPKARPPVPAGSDTLRELNLLGQDADAWALWQTEFRDPQTPSVAEQFTDGVMRLGIGDNLDGIFMVSYLSERETPAEQAEYKKLKQQLGYWYALYPFPFMGEIEAWSAERQLNPLLVTALIRQESRFMPNIKSVVGATGLMQVMPETGDWIAEKINIKQFDLAKPEDNIKLGTWYLDYTHEEYADNSMLAVASYNAGPGAVGKWVTEKGLGDMDEFVETIPYSETRGYVKSVFQNYWNYLRLYNPEISQKLAQVSALHPTVQ